MIILAVILTILGLIMFLKPNWIYIISESWKHDSYAEPSKIYLITNKCVGVFLVILGIVNIIMSIYIKH